MPSVPTLAELKELSDKELTALFDGVSRGVMTSVDFYLAEIRHREQTRIAQNMERFTKQIRWLTIIILVATIVNIVLVALTLWYN